MEAPVDRPSTGLTLTEAVPLGYALVSRIAAQAGIRCLAIKGPVLEAQGLREGHTSIDVDVWVDPARRDDLVAALAAVGWKNRIPNTTAQIVPLHSETLAHPLWPAEIDVHDRFPGFLAEPQDVFEVLWERRTTAKLGEVPVAATDVLGSALVALLHVLRDPARRAAEAQGLRERLFRLLAESQVDELCRLALRTVCAETVLPALGRDHAVVEMIRNPAAEAWALRTQASDMHSVGWVYELTRTPLRRWPGVLSRALLLTEPEIRLLYPAARPGRVGLWTGRLRRLGVGMRGLPAAVRLVRRNR